MHCILRAHFSELRQRQVRSILMSMESMRAPESHERIGDWEVIEKFGAPKNVEHGTEDGIFIGKDFALVCDGVTSHTSEKINGLTPGQFAIHAAFEALKYLQSEGITSDQIVSLLTAAVQDALKLAHTEGKKSPNTRALCLSPFFQTKIKLFGCVIANI